MNDDNTGTNLPAPVPAADLEPLPSPDYGELIETIIAQDVGRGRASADTLDTYTRIMRDWVAWCRVNGVPPSHATAAHAVAYREELARELEFKTRTIELKLTVIRKFYDGLSLRGHVPQPARGSYLNPFKGVRAPKEEGLADDFKALTPGEAELVFRAIPKDQSLRSLRDRAIICLMVIEGMRRVELFRLSREDFSEGPHGPELLIRGKGRKRRGFPREDSWRILARYLEARGPVERDRLADPKHELQPVFVGIDRAGRITGRLSRRDLNRTVDKYFLKAGVKLSGKSCHALRHTCGTLLYQETKSVKAVMEALGHLHSSSADIYVHAVERGKERPTAKIRLDPEG